MMYVKTGIGRRLRRSGVMAEGRRNRSGYGRSRYAPGKQIQHIAQVACNALFLIYYELRKEEKSNE